MIQLQVLTGSKAGQEFQARRFPVCIGRSAQCEFSLEEPGVWDRHLILQLRFPEGFEATVVKEALATVNDEPFQTKRLRNGDVLGLGSLKIAFALSPTRSRSLRLREWLTWLAFAVLFAGQLALIYALPA